MHIDCMEIQNAFSDYLSGKKDKSIKGIESILSKNLKKKIDIRIISNSSRRGFFAMAVIPDTSVIAQVASTIVGNESKISAISELWKTCKHWTLEIDCELFTLLNAGELTALTLHEVGHIIHTDAIPRRIMNIIQYQIAIGNVTKNAILKHSVFNKILEIPITVACQLTGNVNALKEEIRADKMATMNGYLSELTSAISKIVDKLQKNETSNASEFVLKTIENLQKRESKLVEGDFRLLKGGVPKETRLYEAISSVYSSWFESGSNSFTESVDNLDDVIQGVYMLEFGFKRSVKAIEQNQLDYIQIKIQAIKTINDKMMIVSYINGKLEMAYYYLDILNNPRQSKKYKIPHTKAALEDMILFLENMKQEAIKKPIPDIYEFNPLYPEGYEG